MAETFAQGDDLGGEALLNRMGMNVYQTIGQAVQDAVMPEPAVLGDKEELSK